MSPIPADFKLQGSPPEVTPRTDMSDAEIELIAEFCDVPVEKVRGIVWLAEWRMRTTPDWLTGPVGDRP